MPMKYKALSLKETAIIIAEIRKGINRKFGFFLHGYYTVPYAYRISYNSKIFEV